MTQRARLIFFAVLGVSIVSPAHADPVSIAIIGAIAAPGFVASTALVAVVTFGLELTASLALSYLASVLTKKGAGQSNFSIQGSLQWGAVVPRRFPLGVCMDPGSEFYPARTWGQDGKTPNAYFTRFIALSDVPTTLSGFIADDKVCTYGSGTPDANLGFAIPEYNSGGRDHMWVKFYDGSQTAADPWAVAQFAGDPTYPYDGAMVGQGIAYALVTALIDQTLFTAVPAYKFVLGGIGLYDPTQDASVGGSGSQSWADPASWTASKNPAVAKYNVLRGIFWNGVWVYGLQNSTADCCPLDNWFAAINADASLVQYQAGVNVAQFQCGGMVDVSTTPTDLLVELSKCDNGRLTEVGGLFVTRSGPSAAPVMSFDDTQLLISEAKTFNPFPDQSQIYNAVTATWPDPSSNWTMVDAPALYDPALEAADGGARQILDIQFNFVPYGDQIQGCMKFNRDEKRKFRTHTVIAPPRAVVLDAFDTIAWTSAENGYVAKVFEVIPTDQDNIDQALFLTETDPGDYDWTPGSDYRPYTSVPIVGQTVPSQAMVGWRVQAQEAPGDNGLAQPGILILWATDGIDDVDGIIYEVQLAATGAAITSGETIHSVAEFLDGEAIITGGLSAATTYNVRGRYRPISVRDTDWSAWLPVTTDDVMVGHADISAEAEQLLNFLGAGFNDMWEQIQQLSQSISETGQGASYDLQELRRVLMVSQDNQTASFNEQIDVAVGDNSAIVTMLTELQGQVNDPTTGLSATFDIATESFGMALQCFAEYLGGGPRRRARWPRSVGNLNSTLVGYSPTATVQSAILVKAGLERSKRLQAGTAEWLQAYVGTRSPDAASRVQERQFTRARRQARQMSVSADAAAARAPRRGTVHFRLTAFIPTCTSPRLRSCVPRWHGRWGFVHRRWNSSVGA